MPTESRLDLAVQKIRQWVNHSGLYDRLQESKADWNELCSCMDVIEDTEWAVSSYTPTDRDVPLGTRYLVTYGVIQALFLQQDAVSGLCRLLGHPRDVLEYPEIRMIRTVRNKSIGHPTRHTGKGLPESSNFISQQTLTGGEFTLITLDHLGFHSETVNIPQMIEQQIGILGNVLRELYEAIEAVSPFEQIL